MEYKRNYTNRRSFRYFVSLTLLLCCLHTTQAQDRFAELSHQLDEVAKISPGLNEPIEISQQGVSIQEFLRGLADKKGLNLSVSTDIEVSIYNKFSNETVKNILLFLCREHDLDIHFNNSIMSFYKRKEPEPTPEPEKKPHVVYSKSTNSLHMRLRQEKIGDVLEQIGEQSGQSVITDASIPSSTIVNGYYAKSNFETVLEEFAIHNGFELEKTDKYFKFKKAAIDPQKQQANKTNPRYSSGKKNKSGGSGQIHDLKIAPGETDVLVSLDASDIPLADLIAAVSVEAKKDYFLFSAPSGNITAYLDAVPYPDFLNLVLQGTDHTYKTEENIYLIGERKSEGLRTTKVMTLQYRSFTDVLQVIPSELKQGVEMNEFSELNSFIMSGSEPQIKEIEAFVKEIDQIVPMVMIEIIMVDIRKGKALKTGISAGLADTTSGGTLLPGLNLVLSSATINRALSGNNVNLGRVTRDFYIGLSALEEMDQANVRSMPKLATLNGHEASMTIGETRYYKLQTQNVVGGLNNNTIVTDQWNSVQADMSISINPVISGDDHVTLDIDVGISDFIGEPPANQPPASTNRQFTSLVRVKDQEMILLGGMERESKSESGSGVPILSRIPVIKWFFSSKSKSRSKQISFVFIKPTIIH